MMMMMMTMMMMALALKKTSFEKIVAFFDFQSRIERVQIVQQHIVLEFTKQTGKFVTGLRSFNKLKSKEAKVCLTLGYLR